MPLFDYQCDGCGTIEEFLIRNEADSDAVTDFVCPSCGNTGSMQKTIGIPSRSSADTQMTPDSVTGGKWGELMDRIKKNGAGIDAGAQQNLDRASSRTGRRWR